MMKSPVYPRYDGGDYGFDPQVDFTQFLEEARKNAREERSDEDHPQCQQGNKKRETNEAKRSKKSWKRSFLSWWKADKKSNSGMEQLPNSPTPKPRRGGRVSSSGPLYGTGGGGSGVTCKPRGPASGPLANLFRQAKSAENEMPYMCLDKIDDPPCVTSYGPVYLVT